MNRLQYELSPYLFSHSTDAVDWLPWGSEALEIARAEQKPLFIALGTQSADAGCGSQLGTAARLAARYYVPVQVDIREHPDVAAYYIRAARRLLGAGDVPLQVLSDSEGRPFYISRPLSEVELAGLLSGVAMHWNSDPSGYRRTAAMLAREAEEVTDTLPLPELWDRHFRWLLARYDSECGGFGTGAKALLPQELLFLLTYARYTGEALPLDMAVFTLTQMAQSGVRDHIGGGFFHGTADRHWYRPLPEKRLLDQAWLLDCYVTAYAAAGEALFADVARETADFVLRELRHAAGSFYAGQWSADGFYDFTTAEVAALRRVCRTQDAEGLPLHRLRMELYRNRLERGRPHRDDQILVGQNGVMIAALCRAGRVLGVGRYLTAACLAEAFLRQRLVDVMDLRRYWCYGCAAGEGALEDFAGYALGQLELYRSGCGSEHLRAAAKVMARADALFSDGPEGGYFLTRGQNRLPRRPKQLWDESVPSAWSVALGVLVQLAEEVRHPGLRRRAGELAAQVDEGCAYGLAMCMPE